MLEFNRNFMVINSVLNSADGRPVRSSVRMLRAPIFHHHHLTWPNSLSNTQYLRGQWLAGTAAILNQRGDAASFLGRSQFLCSMFLRHLLTGFRIFSRKHDSISKGALETSSNTNLPEIRRVSTS
jgi:hypothetical protein